MNIWKIKGFIPLLLIIFTNTFIDFGHKILVQNLIFKYMSGSMQVMFTAILSITIIFPFIILYLPASYVVDKFSKKKSIRLSISASILITLFIFISYLTGQFWLAFLLTFALSAQTVFFSPAKIAYLRELIGKEKLAEANGYISSVILASAMGAIFTFSVILEYKIGNVLPGISKSLQSMSLLGFILLGLAIFQTIITNFLPKTNPETSARTLPFINPLKVIVRSEVIWLSVIGLSLFWGINHVVMANFGAYLKELASVNNTIVIQGLLAIGAIGLVIGSFLAGRMSRDYIEIGHLPICVLMMTICLLIFPFITNLYIIGIIFFGFGILGGFFIVPLNALIQFHAGKNKLGSVIAGSNLIQNSVMTIALLITVILSMKTIPPIIIFYLLAIFSIGCAIYIFYKLPFSLARFIIMKLFTQRYKIMVEGINNIPIDKAGLLMGNHITIIDWAILQIACPRPIRFVASRRAMDNPLHAIFLKLNKSILISPSKAKDAIVTIQQALKDGSLVALFPEGHWTRNGQLSEFQKGFELAVKGTGADIIPFYIHGLWGSRFSHASSKNRETQNIKFFRPIYVYFGKPLSDSANVQDVKKAVLKLAIHTWQAYAKNLKSLQYTFLETAKKYHNKLAIIDYDHKTYNFQKLLTYSLFIANNIGSKMKNNSKVAIILPTSFMGIASNLAVWMNQGTSININFTQEKELIKNCLIQSNPTVIVTSKSFLQKLQDKGFDTDIFTNNYPIFYLEDLKNKKLSFIGASILARLPKFLLHWRIKSKSIQNTATILFSSGSESKPKGIELSHQNILCNIKQVSTIISMRHDDIMVNSLPLFHAFGLTVSTLLPIYSGLPSICYPNPTDALGISKMIARYKGTILPGTSSFFRLYLRHPKIHPVMLQSIRFAIAGAEKLQEEIRRGLKEKFNILVYEGYGATEVSPVASINLPDEIIDDTCRIQIGNKEKTVGMSLPGSMFKIIDPETNQELPNETPGLILIGGVQIMKGYLDNIQKTQEVLYEEDGIVWYKTGDKGKLDKDEFLTIIDRYSRFAKIAGEMISLTKVEQSCKNLLPTLDIDLAVISIPDSKKGEKLIVIIEESNQLTSSDFSKLIKANLPPLMQPSQVSVLKTIPKLPSGKTNYQALKAMFINERENLKSSRI